MTLSTSASLKQVFDEFERIKNSIRIIKESEVAKGTGQYSSTRELFVWPYEGYANEGSVIKVPLDMLQSAEKNLITENIKEGINIFGLNGTLEERKFATGLIYPNWDDKKSFNGLVSPITSNWVNLSGLFDFEPSIIIMKANKPYTSIDASLTLYSKSEGTVTLSKVTANNNHSTYAATFPLSKNPEIGLSMMPVAMPYSLSTNEIRYYALQ